MNLALYEPEIPQNTGTLLRLGACLGVGIDIIDPCGFVWNDQKLRRAGMDYIDLSTVTRHASWEMFAHHMHEKKKRIVLVDAAAPVSFLDFTFCADDTLLMGKESCGVPETLMKALPHHVKIPMIAGRRSLNMAIAAGMVLTEALRQTHLFPAHLLSER